MGLGALWYSPVLFANIWMKEAGVSMEEVNASQGKMGLIYGMTGLGALLTSYVIGVLVNSLGIQDIMGALVFAIVVWAGTNIPPIIKNWGFEGRTIKLGIINHGYDLVVYILIAILYVLF